MRWYAINAIPYGHHERYNNDEKMKRKKKGLPWGGANALVFLVFLVRRVPGKHVLDHADRTAPFRQHELDHTDHTDLP